MPRSEVFVVPHYKNCIFSHLLLVVCSFWFYVPTFHTSSTQCCQIWLTPNSPERTSNLLFSTGVLFLNNRHTHTHMVLGKRCKFNLFILWSLNCLCCLFKAFSLFLYVEILKKGLNGESSKSTCSQYLAGKCQNFLPLLQKNQHLDNINRFTSP